MSNLNNGNNTGANFTPWQYIAFSDDPEYSDLQSKYEYLTRKFSSLSRNDPKYAQTLNNLTRCEKQIADKQIADWLGGQIDFGGDVDGYYGPADNGNSNY